MADSGGGPHGIITEMKFLADMGIAMRIVEWLRKGGHDAIHLREDGLHELPDTEIFQKAVSEGRVILTLN